MLKILKKIFLNKLRDYNRRNVINCLLQKILHNNDYKNLKVYFDKWKEMIENINYEKKLLLNLVKVYDSSSRLSLQRYLYKWLNYTNVSKRIDVNKFADLNKVYIVLNIFI